jgi:GNAT superfamily N-acetyltransferase
MASVLTYRVAATWLARTPSYRLGAEEGAAPSKGKGGVPPKWNEWLKAVWDGGSAKVPNPNPDTKSRYNSVSFSTALKYKPYYEKAKGDFYKWLENEKSDDKPKEKPEKDLEPKEKKDPIIEKFFDKGKGPSNKKLEDLFSSSDIKATVEKIEEFSSEDKYDGVAKKGVKVSLVLKDKSGAPVGEVKRSFFRDSKGALIVNHDLLELKESHQGTGYGKKILSDSLDVYQEMGVKEITLEAGMVGKYVWARMGFEASDKKEFEGLKNDFLDTYLKDYADLEYSDEEIEEIRKTVAPMKTMKDLASLKIDGETVGKSYLLDFAVNWQGRLPLDPNSESYKTVKGYLKS